METWKEQGLTRETVGLRCGRGLIEVEEGKGIRCKRKCKKEKRQELQQKYNQVGKEPPCYDRRADPCSCPVKHHEGNEPIIYLPVEWSSICFVSSLDRPHGTFHGAQSCCCGSRPGRTYGAFPPETHSGAGPSRPVATPEDDSGPTGPFSSECLEGC